MAEAQEAQLSHSTLATLVQDPVKQPALKKNQSALLTLPPELLNRIVYHLPRHGDPHMLSLMKTCSTLYRLLRHDMVVTFFKNCKRAYTIFCLRDAKPGEFGWRPFSLLNAEYGEEEGAVYVVAVEHLFDVYKPTCATRDYLGVELTATEVSVVFELSDWPDNGEVREDWAPSIRGRLVKATPKLVRERFPCPECDDTGIVAYGSGNVALRWPDIEEHPLPWDADCPRCTISYGDAVQQHEIYVEEFEDAAREHAAEMMEAFDEYDEFEF